MADFPALPLWTDAYLADTRHLTTLEHGAYLLLMMEAWRRPHTNLPDDDRILARLTGLSAVEWDAVKAVVMDLWFLDRRKKVWTQKRLSAEKVYVAEKSASQRDRATKRWNKRENDDAPALPFGCPDDAPTPTPTPTPNIISFPNGKDSSVEPPLTVEEVVEGWNDLAGDLDLAKVIKLTPQRRKATQARLREYPDLASWKAAFRHIRNTPFLRGETTDWRANFDFLVQASSFTKLVEGVYGKKQA